MNEELISVSWFISVFLKPECPETESRVYSRRLYEQRENKINQLLNKRRN